MEACARESAESTLSILAHYLVFYFSFNGWEVGLIVKVEE
jgi:hypothetical protein